MEKTNVRELQDVVIRFSGDSGDGMQLTGTLFSDTSALIGNGISTFPDFRPRYARRRGPFPESRDFRCTIGDHPVSTPGDYCDVLVAMNPAALRANARWLKPGATIICDGDTFNDRSVERAGLPDVRSGDGDRTCRTIMSSFPHMTSMTREAVASGRSGSQGRGPNARICSRWASAFVSTIVRWTMPSISFAASSRKSRPSPRRTCWRSRADIIMRPTRTRLPIPMW